MITDSLRKFIFQKTERKKTVQRLLYQGVNYAMVVKKWKAMLGGIQFVIYDPLSLPHPHSNSTNLNLRQLNNNQNQMKTTGAQNLKEFSNAAGWLSVFCNELIIKYSQPQTTPPPP